MSQVALTVVCEIEGARLAELRQTLKTIGDDVVGNPILRLDQVPLTHFLRWVILDNDPELPPQLVFEANHDGTTASYLATLAGITPVAAGLDAIFGCCRGWPTRGARDVAGFREFVAARALRAEAYYCGYRGVSAAQVRNDLRLHALIGDFLDRERPRLATLPPHAIQARIAAWLAEEQRRDPTLSTAPEDEDHWDRRLRLAAVAVAVVPAALALVPLAALAWLLLPCRNRNDEVGRYDRPVHAPLELVVREDHVTQNQLTHLVELKPGLLRYLILRGVLFGVDLLARLYYLDGHLGGITTIHFARWVLLHDPRSGARPPRHRLLFLSNYDGTWESYLGDFIDQNAPWLTAVWSNTQDFPRATGLWGDGASDEEAFKQWTRDHQLSSQVWYSNVPAWTVRNIRNDIWIRSRVERALSDDDCRQWLARL